MNSCLACRDPPEETLTERSQNEEKDHNASSMESPRVDLDVKVSFVSEA